MTEYGVIGVLVTLIGLGVAVVTPIIKLNTNITKLTVLLDSIRTEQDGYEKRNHESHAKLWEHNTKQDELLQQHEADIRYLKRDTKE